VRQAKLLEQVTARMSCNGVQHANMPAFGAGNCFVYPQVIPMLLTSILEIVC